MLVIRLQRTGRKGHAMFRIVVQDSRRTPTSDQKAAEAIKSHLNELNPGRDISFELGPATIARIETHDLHPNYWN